MRRILAAVALVTSSCAYSLEDDAYGLRAEISRLERSVPPEAPLWISEGPDRFELFVEDYTERVPEYIYLHILRKLHAMGIQEAEGLSQGDFDFSACEAQPGPFRGKTWGVRGLIARFEPKTLEGKDVPVRRVHEGVLFDHRRHPVVFHVVDKPDVLALREDHVELQAVFVKMLEYTSVSGRRVVAPFFIGKVLRRFV